MQRCTPTSYMFIMSNALLTWLMLHACAWLQKTLGVVGNRRLHIGAVKIAERMVVHAVNAEVL